MSLKESGKKPVHPIETIAVLALAATFIGILFKVKWMPYVTFCLLFIGLFAKGASRFISHWWMRFAVLLGTFNAKMLLTIVFFVLLTPIAYVYRIFKGDTIVLKRRPSSATYWHERNHLFAPADFERMF